MLIFDAHADTLYAMQFSGNDLQAKEIAEERTPLFDHVCVQAMALYTGPKGLQEDPGMIARQLDMLEKLKDQGFQQIVRMQDARKNGSYILLTIEGGDIFHDGVYRVDQYYEKGVRSAAIVWNHPNWLASPAVGGSQRGLTSFGREVVSRMHAVGMAVDVSHLNEAGVRDVLQMEGPAPMASHSCARALCDHPRNLTDEQLRALFSAGGFVGVNFYPVFLSESGKATIDTVIDHIAHMFFLGGGKCVGLGSDFYGIDQHPIGLRHAGDILALFDRMLQRGFSQVQVQAVAGGNFVQYMEEIVPQ